MATKAKRNMPAVERKIALCYVRQSITRNPNDMDSPDRQRANIEGVCRAKGWIPEWYVDAEGHKSGTKENNRPGWLALQARLGDPDIVALVANDLARLHRKGWRVGRLVDMLEERGVYLVLAAPGRDLDLSKPQDRIAIAIIAMMDEWYAYDVSQRQKDNALYLKSQGKSVGTPPFGSRRNAEGYLIPTKRGAWLLPDGTYMDGIEGDEPPVEGAIFRSYYQAAKRAMEIYISSKRGREHVTRRLSAEGWVFKDRYGKPRSFVPDDVRRITSNWREYAGMVTGGPAKDKNASLIDDPVGELVDTGRAIFPLDLLRRVAEVQKDRSKTTNLTSPKEVSKTYALSGILYCAHCERVAHQKKNPKHRAKLSGHIADGTPRYRHQERHTCEGKARSVPANLIEEDFSRLIHLLTINPEAIPLMVELSIDKDNPAPHGQSDVDLDVEKQQAIAKCRRRIEAARHLYEDGDLTREEYLKRKEQNELEITHWQARTSDTQQKALELTLCMELVDKLSRLWDVATDEDKQGMAHSLFEYLVYDLDTQQITDFRLKPWAEPFLVLRGALYDNDPSGGAPVESSGDTGEETKKSDLNDPTVSCPHGYLSRTTFEYGWLQQCA
jgi:DNA invertase Pin-like site-specific DNA recombinase